MRKVLFGIIFVFISVSANAQFSARYSKLHLGNPGVEFKLTSDETDAKEEGGGAFTLARPNDFTKDEIMALYRYFEEHKEEIEKKYNVIIARNSLDFVSYGCTPEIVIYDRDTSQEYWNEYFKRLKDRKEEAKAKIESLFNK